MKRLPKILFLHWKEELILSGLQWAFEKEGHETKEIKIQENTSLESLIELMEDFDFDLVITHCFYIFDAYRSGSGLEQYFGERHIKVLAWYWENPWSSGSFQWLSRFNRGDISKNIHFMLVDREHLEMFQARKLSSSYLPLGVDERLFSWQPTESMQFELELSHCGKPCNQIQFSVKSDTEFLDAYVELGLLELKDRLMNLKLWQDGDESKLRKLGLPIFMFFKSEISSAQDFIRMKQSFTETAKTQIPESWWNAFRELSGRFDFLFSWHSLHRIVWDLVPHGLYVYGGDDWKKFLIPHYGHSTPRLSEDGLLQLYQQSLAQLCVTKWQFRYAVHERPFKILAVGGLPLNDFREDLHKLFDPDEVLVYRDQPEILDIVGMLKSDSKKRQQYIEKGRRRVQEHHTLRHRSFEMLELI